MRCTLQRHRYCRRKRDGLFAAAGEQSQQTVHPAVFQLVRRPSAGFQNVLSIKVRAVPVRRCHRVQEARFSGSVELPQLRQCGVKGEGSIEFQGGCRVYRKRAARAGIGGLRIRNDCVQSVRGAALNDEDEASLGRGLRKKHLR